MGENVRRLRVKRDMTLAMLAGELGISHQQLQKYETASNRLSAGMLCRISEVLGVPVNTLFEAESATGAHGRASAPDPVGELRREGAFLLARTQSEHILRQMVQVLKALS